MAASNNALRKTGAAIVDDGNGIILYFTHATFLLLMRYRRYLSDATPTLRLASPLSAPSRRLAPRSGGCARATRRTRSTGPPALRAGRSGGAPQGRAARGR